MSTIRGRLDKLRSDLMTRGEIALEKPEIVTAGRCLIRFVMGAVLSGANIFGTGAPFAVSAVAISGAGMEGFFALLGATGGYLARMGLVGGLKYISACILVFAAAYVFRDTKSYEKSWFMPVIAAIMSICTGFVYASDAGWTIGATATFLTEVILIAGCTYFYRIALSGLLPAEKEGDERKKAVSMLILAATVLIALSGLTILGEISVGRIIAQLIIIILAFRLSLGVGCSAGVSMGLAMDSCSGLGAPLYSMAYGISGLIAGIFNKCGKLVFTVSFILADCVSVLWTWGSVFQVSLLYETFIVSVIFMLIPMSVLEHVQMPEEASSYYGAVRLREYVRERVERLSGAFRQLHKASREVVLMPTNDGDVASIFDKAADVCCRSCKMKNSCWTVDYESTIDAMNKATEPMLDRGSMKIQDLPPYFVQKCKNVDLLVAAINGELKGLLYRRQFQSRINDNRLLLMEQYGDMSGILKSVAGDLQTELTFLPYEERRLMRYLKALGVNGQAAVFRDRNSRLHVHITGESLKTLAGDEEYLDKLSALMQVRLCRLELEDDTHMSLMEAEPMAAAVGIASARKKGEQVSGDRGTYFKTDEGILYIMLSDGMGTGCEAAKESQVATGILREFLTAGIDPMTAMKLLSGAMAVRSEMSTGFATVDLMGINLFTGRTKVYKCGAAPTYVKRGKVVKLVRSDSLACGIDRSGMPMPEETDIELQPGHIALIASDGVSVEGDDMWLREMLSEYRGIEAKELARLVVERAMELYGCEDDMTVLTVFLQERD